MKITRKSKRIRAIVKNIVALKEQKLIPKNPPITQTEKIGMLLENKPLLKPDDSLNSLAATKGIISEMLIGTEEVYQKIDELYSFIEETVTTMNESNQSINLISNTAQSISDNTNTAKSISDICMLDINDTLSSIEDIAKKSNTINDIVTLIENISVKIRVLALNIAIEAARAGDSGKGFRIISEEVRKLSETTEREIKTIRINVAEITSTITKTRNFSDKTALNLNHLNSNICENNNHLKEISTALMQQASCTTMILSQTHNICDAIAFIKEVFDYVVEYNKKGKDQCDIVASTITGCTDKINLSIDEFIQQVKNSVSITNK